MIKMSWEKILKKSGEKPYVEDKSRRKDFQDIGDEMTGHETVQDLVDEGLVSPLSNPKWLDKDKEYDCEQCDEKAEFELPDKQIRTFCKKCLQTRLDAYNKKFTIYGR